MLPLDRVLEEAAIVGTVALHCVPEILQVRVTAQAWIERAFLFLFR